MPRDVQVIHVHAPAQGGAGGHSVQASKVSVVVVTTTAVPLTGGGHQRAGAQGTAGVWGKAIRVSGRGLLWMHVPAVLLHRFRAENARGTFSCQLGEAFSPSPLLYAGACPT